MNMETATATRTKWIIDPTHSEILFKVKHLMITNVKGEFRKFSAEVLGEDFTKASISATIDASSVFTNDETRDGHLKSADFFEVEKYPSITFKGTSLKKIDEERH